MSNTSMLCFLAQNKQRKQLKCSSGVVFGDRRFMQLFAGVPWRSGDLDSCNAHLRHTGTATTLLFTRLDIWA